MKIYIHTDLEGISGIDSIEMMGKENPRHGYAIKRLMMDVNAAIDGAFIGGATHVTVSDGHGGGGNFDLSLLDRRAEFDTKESNVWCGELDGTYNGSFFIGAHAMAGTINGFLDHTMSSASWFNYRINGRKVGELAIWAAVCGHFDVPMLMVSGDEAACTEAFQFFDPVECTAVKRGLGRNKAELVNVDEAAERIRKAACKAISLVGKARPYKPILPMNIKLEYYRSDYCDEAAKKEGMERLDARTVRKVANSYLDFMI
jgi:D-aminopeptidase